MHCLGCLIGVVLNLIILCEQCDDMVDAKMYIFVNVIQGKFVFICCCRLFLRFKKVLKFFFFWYIYLFDRGSGISIFLFGRCEEESSSTNKEKYQILIVKLIYLSHTH